jgi:hypothetical protein
MMGDTISKSILPVSDTVSADAAQEFRRKAVQCFRLARGAVSFEMAQTLSRIGHEYEAAADRLERGETVLETDAV